MRRLVGPGLGLLLAGTALGPLAAQRLPDWRLVSLEEPRPNPIFPAALIPFSIQPEVCRRGHKPVVTLQVFGVLSTAATLPLRDRRSVPLDSTSLSCGNFVAIWDGTIDGGARVAPQGVYYVQLNVDGREKTVKLVVKSPP